MEKNMFEQQVETTEKAPVSPKNWKIAFTTGFDFETKKMSYTSIDIYRDLHCWEMRFNWVPFGYYKSWNFTINVKAGMLQDLKYNMRNSYQDNQNYIIQ